MIFLYIGLPLLTMFVLSYWFIQKKDKAYLKDIRQLLSEYGTIDGNHYQIKDQTYDIHFFRVTSGGELIINSPIVWEVRNGSGQRLYDQKHLKDKKQKIVIVYPTTTPIKRYINENEMLFITYKHYFNDMYVVRIDELKPFLKEMLS